MEATTLPVLLLFALLLAGQRCCGFSVELIHRDSPRSPFHDPALSPAERMLAAARRSLVASTSSGEGGAVSQIVTRSFEYLMSVNVGTPPTQFLAIVHTGSDLVWFTCGNSSSSRDSSQPVRVLFDPATSSSYGGPVGCQSDACKALGQPAAASCDDAGGSNGSCQFRYTYGDGDRTTGLLSTETFSFADGSGNGNGNGNGSDGDAMLLFRVHKVAFGCANYRDAPLFLADGIAGLNGGALSLVTQLAAAAAAPDFGRRFSYCLVPFAATNASSALNFGARAVVSSEPGAATTPLVAAASSAVELESVAVGGQTVASKNNSSSLVVVVVDSGTPQTILDPALRQPLAAELRRRIALPPAPSLDPELLDVCYNVTGRDAAAAADSYWGRAIPDVTLRFGGGAAVTLRPENTFTVVEGGALRRRRTRLCPARLNLQQKPTRADGRGAPPAAAGHVGRDGAELHRVLRRLRPRLRGNRPHPHPPPPRLTLRVLLLVVVLLVPGHRPQARLLRRRRRPLSTRRRARRLRRSTGAQGAGGRVAAGEVLPQERARRRRRLQQGVQAGRQVRQGGRRRRAVPAEGGPRGLRRLRPATPRAPGQVLLPLHHPQVRGRREEARGRGERDGVCAHVRGQGRRLDARRRRPLEDVCGNLPTPSSHEKF